jgi:hypothetical protein
MVRIQHTVPLRVSAILTVLKDAHSRARFPVLNVALASADRDASHRKLQVLGEMGQSGEKIPDTWRMSGFCGAERVEKFSRGHTNTTSFPADSAESEPKDSAKTNRRWRAPEIESLACACAVGGAWIRRQLFQKPSAKVGDFGEARQ